MTDKFHLQSSFTITTAREWVCWWNSDGTFEFVWHLDSQCNVIARLDWRGLASNALFWSAFLTLLVVMKGRVITLSVTEVGEGRKLSCCIFVLLGGPTASFR
jgi:hypothetical protein